MTVIVDPDICIGCTLCTQICPQEFKMEKDKAVAYQNPVPKDAEGCASDALSQCPVNAIKATD